MTTKGPGSEDGGRWLLLAALFGLALAVLAAGVYVHRVFFQGAVPMDSSGLNLAELPKPPPAAGSSGSPPSAAPADQDSLNLLREANKSTPVAASAPEQPTLPKPVEPPASQPLPGPIPGTTPLPPVHGHLIRPPFVLFDGSHMSSFEKAARTQIYQKVMKACLHYNVSNPPATVQPITGVNVTVKYDYFDIQGSTDRDLCNAIFMHRFPSKGDLRGWQAAFGSHVGHILAQTSWSPIRMHTENRQRGGSCQAYDVAVYVPITIRLPRWNEAGDSKLVQSWEEMIQSLTNHEDTHGTIAIQAANRMVEQFTALRAPNCTALNQQVHALYKSDMTETADEEADWDRRNAQDPTQPF